MYSLRILKFLFLKMKINPFIFIGKAIIYAIIVQLNIFIVFKEFFEISYVAKYLIIKNFFCHAFIRYFPIFGLTYRSEENYSAAAQYRFYLYIRTIALFHMNNHPRFIYGGESLFESLTTKQLILYFPVSSPSSFLMPFFPSSLSFSLSVSLFLTFYLSLSFSLIRTVVKGRTLTLIKFISSP